MKEHHLETTFQIISTFMRMDVCSKSVYENVRNMLYAQVRTPLGKDLPIHIFCNEEEVLAEVQVKAEGEVLSK